MFPLILILFFAAVHALAYTRVVRHLHVKPKTRSWLKYLLLLNLAGIVGYLASRYALSPPRSLYFALSLSIGIGFLLFIGTILYEFLRLLQKHVPFDDRKRAFFKRSTDLGFLSLGSAYVGAGIFEGSKEPVVQFVRVEQNRFNGRSYRVVQISDMHIGGLIDRAFVERSVEAINALEPDLIAITGDLCDAHVDLLRDSIDELRRLKSRYGTYYVVGNHEYFHDVAATIAHLKTLGIHVLENSSVPINGDFYIAGVHDLFGYRADTFAPDISRATENIPPSAPTLLLAHQPKYIEHLQGFEPSLMLCGHTHGGQIWPFGYLVSLAQPYVKGLHALDRDRHIYVNSGIGFWGPPMRLGSSAEITCITWS
jgi:predicted MPP superfamily phosphohydrolase